LAEFLPCKVYVLLNL